MQMMMNLVNQVSGGEVQGAHGHPQGIPEAGSAWQQEQATIEVKDDDEPVDPHAVEPLFKGRHPDDF